MATIETTYIAATYTLGSRIKASTFDASITIPYDHDAYDPQHQAFEVLCKKLDWQGKWVCAARVNQRGNTYIMTSPKNKKLTLRDSHGHKIF
jgi:hypothetical protein